ncbi:adenosylcobinamide-GDP ribazoletransferase [Roseburia sp. MSJ-14]|uniref:adenosylcobinamide-GDP ribazoletransferase n=1 Tax=Roseburia sp. MSJ-14 TaxID=2841514 RepID=UPI001C116854|nr:adenosylcobinamide-GDP ribazoletransferase [Roseburia sp. MSJ-14]MBU5472166.1 adenosylcobinamide-GDP ribazoletransferase [Roseburia sp. MSJ-14]
MKYINACIIAFAMYSKIPMPRADWEKENMKYAMCFFPWVGVVIGACVYLWGRFAGNISVGSILYAAVLTLIPIFITGGIHLDGLLDTADALSSWQTRERRLEILKDSHTGAFAIITCCMYFIAYFGFSSELFEMQRIEGIGVIAIGFFLSRCLSGFSVTAFPCAKDSGLAATFANGADKKRAGKVLIGEGILAIAVMIWVSIPLGIAAVVAALLTFWWYHHMSVEKFGGITGDLAGCFLQVCELMILVAVVVVEKLL